MEYSIADLLRNSGYSDGLFTPEDLASIQLKDRNGRPVVYDPVSKRDRLARPEELIRQLFLHQLLTRYGYPADRIAIEQKVRMGRDTTKSADIIVWDADDPEAAYVIVEVKKPEEREKSGIDQLKTYANAQGAPVAAWTDGASLTILHREEPNRYISVTRLPHASETLADVLNEQVTIDELKRRNRLVAERLTLKSLIEDLEDLVLANAGVDAFEEVFKLVYAKLYDEWAATNERADRRVMFRIGGSTDVQLKEKIDGLFSEAQQKWPGVFIEGDRFNLNAGQLRVCVSFLQDIVLFNSNLQVIDEAFEYLTLEVAKGAKGQYFTPRHVIDMAVKMMNPTRREFVIDTAAGSCGFTVHALFHVWGEEFTAEGPKGWQTEYAREKVYAIDFDSRSVKVAKALNLIAGDGRTNVYRANTLDPRQWDEEVRVGLRPRLRKVKGASQRKENGQAMRYFDFDLLLANPPFAGDITDSRILRQYDLAKKYRGIDADALADDPEALAAYQADPFRHAYEDSGSWDKKQPRDVLFLERNLDFLRPGGRMAIVLPQGRFNNITDDYIRWWVGGHARILGVVGLSPETFRPHTNTKTSVLFLQKWNDDPDAGPLCPEVEDYPIFFATSAHSGKNSRGDYIHIQDLDGAGPLLDLEGHPIVDQDLFDVRDVLAGQIARFRARHARDEDANRLKEEEYARILRHLPARDTIVEAFVAFARQQGLSFWSEDGKDETAIRATAVYDIPAKRNLVLPEPKTYSATFLEFVEAGRLDAEHFRPKNRVVREYLIRHFGGEALGTLGDVLKGTTPKEYTDEGIPVVRSGDLLDLDDTSGCLRADPELVRVHLRPGDVLVSSIGLGSIGKVQVFDHASPHTTVSEVTVIRQQQLNPYFLKAFLASPLGQVQIESWITGATGQLHLRPADVAKIIVPTSGTGDQLEYERLHREARALKEQAALLLDSANRQVETLVLGS